MHRLSQYQSHTQLSHHNCYRYRQFLRLQSGLHLRRLVHQYQHRRFLILQHLFRQHLQSKQPYRLRLLDYLQKLHFRQ